MWSRQFFTSIRRLVNHREDMANMCDASISDKISVLFDPTGDIVGDLYFAAKCGDDKAVRRHAEELREFANDILATLKDV